MARRRPAPAWVAGWLLLGLLAGCGAADGRDAAGAELGAAATAVTATDDTGREVTLPRPASRVVSLIPSVTETVFAIGGAGQVVGRTDFDVAPEMLRLPSVGGGIDPSLETLLSLRPDLVFLWEEGRSAGLRRRLEDAGIATFAVRTRDTSDIFRTVARLGTLLDRGPAADSLAGSIRRGLDEVRASVAGRPRPTVFYIVWNDPPMTAGPNTFIAQVIEVAGGTTAFPDVTTDWPTIALEEVVRRQPEVIVRPIGERREHTLDALRTAPGWRDTRAVRDGRLVAVPADLMNRPGPHLAEAARTMRDALHPDLRREPR